MPFPLIVAHRGDRKTHPENTLTAFEGAIAKGADAIELDVFLTRDGELVVHHDYALGRTVAGTGYVGDYTLAELKRPSAGAWYGPDFVGERIPTLAEVFDLGRRRVRFELELRTPSRPFLERLLGELKRHRVEAEVELTSPHLPLLGAVRAMNPALRTGMFVAPFPAWLSPQSGAAPRVRLSDAARRSGRAPAPCAPRAGLCRCAAGWGLARPRGGP